MFSSEEKNMKQKPINDFMTKAYELLKIPIVSLLLTVAIFVSYSSQALAASGGIMGGSSFSSYDSYESSSSSSESSSSSYYDHSYYSSSSDDESYTASTSVGSVPYKKESDNVILTGYDYLCLFVLFALCLVIFVIFESSKKAMNYQNDASKTSIIKLQVSLLGMARSFQNDLNQNAERADTSTQKGYRNILTESALSLIRHSQYWSSSHLYVSKEESVGTGEKLFSKLSFEERSKFDQETLVNLENNVRKQEIEKQYSEYSELGHEYIVVTFLVATLGILKLPSINNPSDLETVLVKLTCLLEKEILAVQVLWTPQEENDTLSSQRVLQDYPLLKPL
ncbi:hypothetical protein LUZ60_007768 [Juncus effusus]|nr:hypothetical protein LUZ60_007768 [Juncus effusus]